MKEKGKKRNYLHKSMGANGIKFHQDISPYQPRYQFIYEQDVNSKTLDPHEWHPTPTYHLIIQHNNVPILVYSGKCNITLWIRLIKV